MALLLRSPTTPSRPAISSAAAVAIARAVGVHVRRQGEGARPRVEARIGGDRQRPGSRQVHVAIPGLACEVSTVPVTLMTPALAATLPKPPDASAMTPRVSVSPGSIA